MSKHWDGATVLIAQPFSGGLLAAVSYLFDRHTAAKRPAIIVTGAWAEPDGGCAWFINDALRSAGCASNLSPLAPSAL